MRIQYVLPGVMSKTEAGKKEMQRRLGLLQHWAAGGTAVGIVDIDIPVIDPAKAALATAETLVRCGLSHSKKAYPFPPKILAAGRSGW